MTAREEIVAAVARAMCCPKHGCLEIEGTCQARACMDDAEIAVSLCFARAAEMCDQARARSRYGAYIFAGDLSDEFRALAHPPNTAHATATASPAPSSAPASAAAKST